MLLVKSFNYNGNRSIVSQREFDNLMLIDDNYPKYVVTLDPFSPKTTYKGIKQMHLRAFLKQSDF